MSILRGYLMRTVLSTVALVTTLLIGLFVFVLFVGELSDIGKGHYGVWQALQYVLLCLPQQAYQFFPMAALIGCLIGLGTLANHSELIVMRAAGVSIWQILKVITQVAIVLVLVVGVVGESVAPWLSQHAQLSKQQQQTGSQRIITNDGTWVREGNTFIRIARIASPTLLHGVTIYTFNQHHQLIRAQFAKVAEKLQGQWQLQDVTESRFDQAELALTGNVTSHQFTTIIWPVNIKPWLLAEHNKGASPENMNLIKLYTYIHYLKQNGLHYQKYSLSFWHRLLQPFAILIMVLLALPFIFGPLRTLPMGYRIVIGVIVGFGFYFLNQLFGPLSLLYHFPPLLSAVLPLLPFAVLSAVFVRRFN